MKKYKTYIIIGVLLVAAIAGYFLFRSKSGGAVDAMEAVDSADQAAYEQLRALLEANIDKDALNHWLGDAARDIYTGKTPMLDQGRLVNGRMTKVGALLSAYAMGYYPGKDGKDYPHAIDKNTLNSQAYAIFYNYKAQANKL